jgi:hypothetical protein
MKVKPSDGSIVPGFSGEQKVSPEAVIFLPSHMNVSASPRHDVTHLPRRKLADHHRHRRPHGE